MHSHEMLACVHDNYSCIVTQASNMIMAMCCSPLWYKKRWLVITYLPKGPRKSKPLAAKIGCASLGPRGIRDEPVINRTSTKSWDYRHSVPRIKKCSQPLKVCLKFCINWFYAIGVFSRHIMRVNRRRHEIALVPIILELWHRLHSKEQEAIALASCLWLLGGLPYLPVAWGHCWPNPLLAMTSWTLGL